MPRDFDADELPDDLLGAGSDPETTDAQEFNDEITGGRGSPTGEPEIRAVIAQEERDTNLELLDALRAMQGAESIRWKIFRINADEPRKNGYLEECSTARLSMDYLRDTYGSGTYRIRGHHMVGGKFAAQRTIIVAEGAKKNMSDSTTVPGSAPGSNFDFMEYIAQQDARDRARRQEQEERDEKRRRDRMELITVLAPIAGPIIAAMMQNRGPDLSALIAAIKPEPGPNMLEVVQAIKAMKELDAAPAPESSIDQVLKVVDALKEAGFGGGEGKTDLWDLAKEVIKTMGPGLGQGISAVASAIQARATQRPALAGESVPVASAALPAPVAPQAGRAPPAGPIGVHPSFRSPSAPAAPAAKPAPAPAQTLDTQKAEAMGLFDPLSLAPHLPWLKGHIENQLVRAARGSDPELYAEVMLDDFPANTDPTVLGHLLARPDWFNLLKQLDIRVGQFEPWFTALRNAMLGMIQEETGVSFGIRTDGGRTASGALVVNIDGGGSASGPPAGESDEDDGEPVTSP